jgi:hypothetical protein
LRPASGTNASETSVLNGSSFLRSALLHTGYANDSFQETTTSTALTARSPNLLISAQALGLGKVVFIDFGSSPIPQISDQSVVLSNIISDAAGIPPPFWYEASDSQASSTETYSVEGTRGSPVLVWVYNPAPSASTFTLDLNGTYYGVPSSWKTIQIPGPSVTVGSGSDVRIQTTVPAQTLIGVLVVPRTEPHISYSSASVLSQFAYPDQSLYSIQGTYNQSILVTISTNESANQILLDNRTSLPQTSSAGQLYNATSGWYFDGQTDSLFVKYQSTGIDTLRFVFYAPPAPPPIVLPQQMVITILGALIAVEAVTLTFLAFRVRKRGPRIQSADNSNKA